MNQLNQEAAADVATIRAYCLRVIKRAVRRNDVSVGEALVMWRICNEQMPGLRESLEASNTSMDALSVIQKIDGSRREAEKIRQKHWEGTTSQGRELIRKKLWELKRELLKKRGIHPPVLEVDSSNKEVSTVSVETA